MTVVYCTLSVYNYVCQQPYEYKNKFVRHVVMHSPGHSYPISTKSTCIVHAKQFLSESQNCFKYFLFKTLWNLSLAHYRGDEIPLIDTGFEICHVGFASAHHLNQI